jgi:aryl-alcohol dehydrogenase-like predicted oxidoreductase
MQFRQLGRSGLKVSVSGLGCNNFGRRCNPQETAQVVHAALDVGVSLFDTADFYSAGLSEEYLGQALKERRKDAIVATKFGLPLGQGPYQGGASRRYVMQACEASLRRLGTDYIDLYQLHFPDAATPIEETLRALDDLTRAGKIRYAGSSNYAGWQIADAAWIAKTNGFAPYISAQNHYSLLDRRIERDTIPAAEAFGVGILPYFPLASGMLTGKYKRGQPAPNDSRLAANPERAQQALSDANFDIVEKLDAFASARGKSVLDVAIAWLLAQKSVGSVIAGATRPEQVRANAAAAAWTMTQSDVEEVGRMTARL